MDIYHELGLTDKNPSKRVSKISKTDPSNMTKEMMIQDQDLASE